MFEIPSEMSAQELCVKSRWLFGAGWRKHLSVIMGAGYSTVRAWSSDVRPVPGPVAFGINLMCNVMTLATGRTAPTTSSFRQGIAKPDA